MKKNISKIFFKLTPKMEVAGLWITDGWLSYYNFGRGGEGGQISLRLPPGVVSGGKVQNRASLTKILAELYKRTAIGPSKHEQSVILTIPITNVYIQPFVLPVVTSDDLAESAELNMKMISPIDVEKAYYDWQKISEENADQTEMIGAFVAKDVVDEFIVCVQDAGYSVAAVEFSALSIIRAALRANVIDKENPYLILSITPEGLNFSINHQGHLFFHHFMAWNTFQDGAKEISTEKFKEGLTDEIRRIINFYSTNRKGQEVKNMVLISSHYLKEIQEVVAGNFPGLEVRVADPKQVNPAIGAAVRGLSPRSADAEISLASLSALEVFRKRQLGNFILIWRNILLVTLGALLFIFLSSALVLKNISTQVVANDPFQKGVKENTELVSLSEQAQKFNELTSIIKILLAEKYEFGTLISDLDKSSGLFIEIVGINLNGIPPKVKIEGVGGNRDVVKSFQGRLSEQPQFKNVSLPLTDLQEQPNGTVVFVLGLDVERVDSGE
ncbi:hypothetical protein KKH05_02710 [Patescibacteria group bacterium]|nr:hypothetical protein [Patescibacteria group bacterium]